MREGEGVGVEAAIPRVQERANGNRNGRKERLGAVARTQTDGEGEMVSLFIACLAEAMRGGLKYK